MRFSDLKSVGHNVAASLASGLGFPIGFYVTAIFHEARATEKGLIGVDFLRGDISVGEASPSLRRAISLYGDALADLSARQGVRKEDFRRLDAQFGVHPAYGDFFTVTVADWHGRSSTETYLGESGARLYR